MNYLRTTFVMVFLVWSHPVQAHPHIFARYAVTVSPGDAGFINLHFTFKVREIVSPFLAPGDTQLLAKDMLINLEQHPFFLYLDMDGEALGRQVVRLSPNGASNGNKIYNFDLTLPDTLTSFGFSLYDPEYFVSVEQDGVDALVVKVKKLSCLVQMQTVGKTVWGNLQTQYVQCGDKSAPKPIVRNSKKQIPEEFPQNDESHLIGQDMVP